MQIGGFMYKAKGFSLFAVRPGYTVHYILVGGLVG